MLYHPKALKRLSTHSGRLERWLGAERLEQLSNNFRNGGGQGVPWYGPPVNLTDVPGSVWIGGDGDFVGDLGRGFFASAADSMADHLKRLWHEAGKPLYLREPQLGAGFASIADFLTRQRTGYRQYLSGNVTKVGITGVANSPSTLWPASGNPASGAAGSAAPGGRACDSTTTGAMNFNNPSSGTLHLTGADFSASVINNSVMFYDRIFDVAKTMSSTGAESVTGVPTRYQSSVASDADFAGGNFVFIETQTTLGAGAHTWNTCRYRNQAGTDAINFPSIDGNGACIATRFDMGGGGIAGWFMPLASGDTGVMDLNQMQCNASITGAINFVIAHPLGVMMFPQINSLLPFDWLTVRNQAPRIFDNACLALFEMLKPVTTATTYTGTIQAVNAP